MHDLITLLQEIKSGKISFTPRSNSERDRLAFQSVAKALAFANDQGYLDGFLSHRESTTGHRLYISVAVKHGLTYQGEQFLERASAPPLSSPVSIDTHIELLELASQSTLPRIIDRTSSVSYQAALELLEAGHLSGLQVQSANGASIFDASITLSGRLFLEERTRRYGESKTDHREPTRAVTASQLDIGTRVMQLFQLYEADVASTVQLKYVSHEQLVAAFNEFLFHHSARLGINGWADNIQSLRDGGVDAAWHFTLGGRKEKFGVQVKSWGDVEHPTDTFRRTVMAQISESRQMGLSVLFLALAADLTSRPQAEKARGLIADTQRMQDGYVHSISPEKVIGVWQWSQRINLEAMEQIRESGYAALTVIYDSCGNRNQNSWGKGQGGDWSDSRSTTLRDGDVVDLSAVAVSPGDEPSEFQFAVQRPGGVFQVRQDWSETSNWTWRVSADDIGKNVTVKVAVRRKKSFYQFSDADDYTYATYDVLPATS